MIYCTVQKFWATPFFAFFYNKAYLTQNWTICGETVTSDRAKRYLQKMDIANWKFVCSICIYFTTFVQI